MITHSPSSVSGFSSCEPIEITQTYCSLGNTECSTPLGHLSPTGFFACTKTHLIKMGNDVHEPRAALAPSTAASPGWPGFG